MVSGLSRSERLFTLIGKRVSSPAGRLVGQWLGRAQHRSECSATLIPVGDFARAVGDSVRSTYDGSFEVRGLSAPERGSGDSRS